MEASLPESGFVIDGESYAIPTLDTLTLDEERMLYLYSDYVVQDFLSAHPNWTAEEQAEYNAQLLQRVRNPELKRALAHIAYRRRHPEVTDEDALSAIGKVNALVLDIAMLNAGDEDPTKGSTSEPENTSRDSESSTPTSSGSSTETSSEPLGKTPELTGTSESDTSNRGAPRIELVS